MTFTFVLPHVLLSCLYIWVVWYKTNFGLRARVKFCVIFEIAKACLSATVYTRIHQVKHWLDIIGGILKTQVPVSLWACSVPCGVKGRNTQSSNKCHHHFVIYSPLVVVEDDWLSCFDKWLDGLKCSKKPWSTKPAWPVWIHIHIKFDLPCQCSYCPCKIYDSLCKNLCHHSSCHYQQDKKHIDGEARHVYHRVQVNIIDMVLLSFVLTHG